MLLRDRLEKKSIEDRTPKNLKRRSRLKHYKNLNQLHFPLLSTLIGTKKLLHKSFSTPIFSFTFITISLIGFTMFIALKFEENPLLNKKLEPELFLKPKQTLKKNFYKILKQIKPLKTISIEP